MKNIGLLVVLVLILCENASCDMLGRITELLNKTKKIFQDVVAYVTNTSDKHKKMDTRIINDFKNTTIIDDNEITRLDHNDTNNDNREHNINHKHNLMNEFNRENMSIHNHDTTQINVDNSKNISNHERLDVENHNHDHNHMNKSNRENLRNHDYNHINNESREHISNHHDHDYMNSDNREHINNHDHNNMNVDNPKNISCHDHNRMNNNQSSNHDHKNMGSDQHRRMCNDCDSKLMIDGDDKSMSMTDKDQIISHKERCLPTASNEMNILQETTKSEEKTVVIPIIPYINDPSSESNE